MIDLAINGSLLDETLTRNLIDAGVSYFEISLPGVEEKTYQVLTRTDYFRRLPALEALGMKQTGSIVVITFINSGGQPAYLSNITKVTVPSGIKCSDTLPIYLSSEIQPGTTAVATLHFNTTNRVRFGFNLEWQDNKGNVYSK